MVLFKNFLKKIYSELTLLTLMFLFFFQLISDFIETIFALNLITLSLNENILGLLFLFSPILLVFYRRGKSFSDKSLIVVGELMIFCNVINYFLIGQVKMIVAGIGVGCFFIFLPAFIIRKTHEDEEQSGMVLGLGLAIGLSLLIMLRTIGSTFDITTYYLFQWIGWILAFVASLIVYSILLMPQKVIDNEKFSRTNVFPKKESNDIKKSTSNNKILGFTIGLISILILIFFVFSSPTVLSRWTEGNYLVITVILTSTIFIFIYMMMYKPHIITKINQRKLLLWNGLFIFTFVLTIALNQLYFPPYYSEYPIVVYQTSTTIIMQQLPLYIMLILFPIVLIDFTLLSRELIKAKPSTKNLGTSFTVASLFFLLMIFGIIFTTVWDYIPLIGPFFRDMYWFVFLIIGLGVGIPILGVKRQTLIFSKLKKDLKIKMKIMLIMGILTGATIVSVVIFETRPVKPSGSVDSIKVLSYNIQQGYDENGEKNFEGQLKVIKDEDADIIGLIESDFCRISSGNSDIVRLIANELNLYSYYGPKTVTGNFGLALLSKHPIKRARTFYMYSIGEQTATIEAEIEIEGETYNIYIAHLGNYEDPSQRSQQITILNRLENKENVILMGDFNFEIDTNRYNMTVEELDDCWELAGDDDGGFDMDDRIDFIFVSDDLSDDVEECNYLGGSNSDHPAVSVEINV